MWIGFGFVCFGKGGTRLREVCIGSALSRLHLLLSDLVPLRPLVGGAYPFFSYDHLCLAGFLRKRIIIGDCPGMFLEMEVTFPSFC